jgi:hypothetical protein
MKILEKLSTVKLTNLEAGQLVKRNLADVATMDNNIITDLPLKEFLAILGIKEAAYDIALIIIRKNIQTKIVN